MKKNVFVLSILSFGFLSSCNETPVVEDNVSEIKADEIVEEKIIDHPESYEIDGLNIYPSSPSAQFPDAKLTLNSDFSQAVEDGNFNFDFQVENYELGAQTSDVETKGLANSPKGQHIHLIVDNGPYSAHYEGGFEKSFDQGQHIAIAFLSRSYHESVKEAAAHQVFQFTSGIAEDVEDFDLGQEMLFYSRPKGTYTGAGAQKILLDFFLKNTEIAAGANTIKVTVNSKTTFLLDTWQAYFIEGLPMGENTINLQLLNKEGELINTPMNDITRTFTLVDEVKE